MMNPGDIREAALAHGNLEAARIAASILDRVDSFGVAAFRAELSDEWGWELFRMLADHFGYTGAPLNECCERKL